MNGQPRSSCGNPLWAAPRLPIHSTPQVYHMCDIVSTCNIDLFVCPFSMTTVRGIRGGGHRGGGGPWLGPRRLGAQSPGGRIMIARSLDHRPRSAGWLRRGRRGSRGRGGGWPGVRYRLTPRGGSPTPTPTPGIIMHRGPHTVDSARGRLAPGRNSKKAPIPAGGLGPNNPLRVTLACGRLGRGSQRLQRTACTTAGGLSG